MNINNSINNMAGGTGNIIAEDVTKNSVVSGRPGTFDTSGLNTGDVISGKVISTNGNDIYLLVDDNSVLKASLNQDMKLVEGQELSFVVNDKSNGTIFLKILGMDKQAYDLSGKSLQMAGLTVNEKNTAIVNALIDKGQPINKQNIIQFLKLANQYGLENVNRLIDMKKQNIQINAENLHMYERYQNSEHKIMGDLNKVSDNLSKYLENILQGEISLETGKQVHSLLKQMADIFDIKNSVYSDTSVNGELIGNGASGELTDSLAVNNMYQGMSEQISGQILSDIGDSTDSIDKLIINMDNQESVNIENAVSDKNNIPNKEFANSILNSDKTISENIDNYKANSNLKFEDVLKDFEKILEKINNSQIDEVNIKYETEKLGEKIKSIFKDNLLMDFNLSDKNGVQIKDEIEKIYEKYNNLADVIKNMVADDKGTSLKNSANEMKNNLMFMNELNQVNPYVQIPVKMKSQEAEGELYVYARKNKKELSKDVLSAFLHLDMDNLGPTDVDVKLKGKVVEVSFTLNNNAAKNLIMDNMKELISALESKGYSSKIYGKTIEKEDEESYKPLYPLMGEEVTASAKKFAFDIKA